MSKNKILIVSQIFEIETTQKIAAYITTETRVLNLNSGSRSVLPMIVIICVTQITNKIICLLNSANIVDIKTDSLTNIWQPKTIGIRCQHDLVSASASGSLGHQIHQAYNLTTIRVPLQKSLNQSR